MRSPYRPFPIILAFALSAGATVVQAADPAGSPAKVAVPAHSTASGGSESGLAAVYSDRLNGHRTASGKRYRRDELTAAHKTLPFGTRVKVTRVKTGKSVELVINDRGPRQAGRVLDISPAAAKVLGFSRHGMAEVTVEVVSGASQG